MPRRVIQLLFDEDVTVELVQVAVAAGHWASRHVNDARLNGRDDSAVLDDAVAHELTLVTENGRDFRKLLWRGEASPGRHELHPGLVIIEAGNLLAAEEVAWFSAFLRWVEGRADLINRIVEVQSSLPEDRRVRASAYGSTSSPRQGRAAGGRPRFGLSSAHSAARRTCSSVRVG